jgi:hypothetical protein
MNKSPGGPSRDHSVFFRGTLRAEASPYVPRAPRSLVDLPFSLAGPILLESLAELVLRVSYDGTRYSIDLAQPELSTIIPNRPNTSTRLTDPSTPPLLLTCRRLRLQSHTVIRENLPTTLIFDCPGSIAQFLWSLNMLRSGFFDVRLVRLHCLMNVQHITIRFGESQEHFDPNAFRSLQRVDVEFQHSSLYQTPPR